MLNPAEQPDTADYAMHMAYENKKRIESEIETLKAELQQVKAERDRLKEALFAILEQHVVYEIKLIATDALNESEECCFGLD